MRVLKLRNKLLKLPLIQGGMGVGVSLSSLAGAVAKCGAMGVISAANIGYDLQENLLSDLEVNKKSLIHHIKKANDISKGNGLIGVNVMVAMTAYKEMVQCAASAGADAVICGAGLPLDLPQIVGENMLFAPIVSSLKALKILVKVWLKRYEKLMDFVVVEGADAGGHLGITRDKLASYSLPEVVSQIRTYIDELNQKFKLDIKLFAAGGIRNKADVAQIICAGADGVQVATPFIATKECDACDAFKQTIINATDEQLEIINSPVGMIGRAVKNEFTMLASKQRIAPTKCINCIKICNPSETPYCISEALTSSVKSGAGLVFSGNKINTIDRIKTVKEVIEELIE
ncbi:MAG: nitronate monooxygenase [Clostridiales bacterium]|nr:MAG: nitronate monooxygenase [Clostridiales bacterium]